MIAAILLLLPIWWSAIRWVRQSPESKGWATFGVVSVVAIFLLLYLLACFDSYLIDGEPLVWFAGISIWPSAFFCLIAFCLALGFCISVVVQTTQAHDEISERFFEQAER